MESTSVHPPAPEKDRETLHEPSILCSCVAYLNSLDPRVPLKNASEFTPNATPQEGGVALFYYPTSGEHHVARIERLSGEGFYTTEANFKQCEKTERFVPFEDPRLIGFWSPTGGSP